MRILIYSLRFNPLKGGAERQANFFFKFLKEKKEKVKVLTFREKDEKFCCKDIISFKLTRIKIFDTFISIFFGFFYLLFNIKKYEIIFCYLASSNALLSSILGKIFNVKVFLRFGGGRNTGDIGTSKKTFSGRIKLFFIKKLADKFIVQSEELKEELLKEGFKKEKIFIIPNGVDTEKFSPVSEEEKSKLRQKFLLNNFKRIINYTGRLNRFKGIYDLIEVFEEIEREDVCLLVIGEGEERKEIEEIIKKRNLKNVILKGLVENVDEYYKVSDIFVLPSYGEGMSNSLLEAMATGLIPVATDIGGNNEVIRNGETGFLFSPGDKERLKEILENLIEYYFEFLNIGINAREEILKNYTLEKILNKYYKLLRV